MVICSWGVLSFEIIKSLQLSIPSALTDSTHYLIICIKMIFKKIPLMNSTMAKVHPTLSLLSRATFGGTFYLVTLTAHNKKHVSEFQRSFTIFYLLAGVFLSQMNSAILSTILVRKSSFTFFKLLCLFYMKIKCIVEQI